jgi:hypothetical protein
LHNSPLHILEVKDILNIIYPQGTKRAIIEKPGLAKVWDVSIVPL